MIALNRCSHTQTVSHRYVVLNRMRSKIQLCLSSLLVHSRARTDTHRWKWERPRCRRVGVEPPTRGAVWLFLLSFNGPQKKSKWHVLCQCFWHLSGINELVKRRVSWWISAEDQECLKDIKACAQQVFREPCGKNFLHCFRRHSFLIPLGIKMSMSPVLQDMNWKPAELCYVATCQFLFQLQACTTWEAWSLWKALHWSFRLQFVV